MSGTNRSDKIRAFVVDDSTICSELLCEQLERDGDIEVVETAASGEEALMRLAAADPDIVTVDLNLPGMSGLALIEAIMSRDPRPILVVTGLDARDRELGVAATERGALALTNKVAIDDHEAAARLRAHVRKLAAVKVKREAPGSGPREGEVEWPSPEPSTATPIVAFGSSAGGPQALFEILARLPRDLPACIAVAHHLPPDFVSAFARLLLSRVAFEVIVADQPVEPESGVLVLAPAGADLILDGGRLCGRTTGVRPGSCPRVDALFQSIASAPGAHVGIVLSGLGDDGALGLQAMRDHGKLTIVQDEASAAVWGMPKAALPAAIEVRPTVEIAHVIDRWLDARARGRGR